MVFSLSLWERAGVRAFVGIFPLILTLSPKGERGPFLAPFYI